MSDFFKNYYWNHAQIGTASPRSLLLHILDSDPTAPRASDGPVAHSCKYCRQVVIDPQLVRSADNKISKDFVLKQVDDINVKEAASHGCELFKYIIQLNLPEPDVEGDISIKIRSPGKWSLMSGLFFQWTPKAGNYEDR